MARSSGAPSTDHHADPPSTAVAWGSLGLLMACLVAVVGLAKTPAPAIEAGVRAAGAPPAVVCVIVAMPETWAAVRAAAHNRLQTSLNLALGSALASIGLTTPPWRC